jgi:hypothetical protein
MTEKFKHKLKYSIDLGIDFLYRNVNDYGNIYGETNLKSHSFAMCVMSKNIIDKEKFDFCFKNVAASTYMKGNTFFVLDENGKISSLLTTMASLLCMYSNNVFWAEKYLNFIFSQKEEDGFISGYEYDKEHIGYSSIIFTKMYEKTKNKKWIEFSKDILKWIISNGTKNYIDVMAVNCIRKHIQELSFDEYVKNITKTNMGIDIISSCWWKFDYNMVENLSYEYISTQQDGSNPITAGGFFDSSGNIDIELTAKKTDILSEILKLYND